MNRLRAIRESKRLTLWGLAVPARVSPTTITGIELHNHIPRQDTRDRIAAALGVPVVEIWPEPSNTKEVAAR